MTLRSPPWDRLQVLEAVKERIWKYLTLSSEVGEIALDAASLLQMRQGEVLVLAQVQFLLSDEVGALLKTLPELVRRLPTTTVHEEAWSAERVRGAVQWSRTVSARMATGLPNLYVTRPPERDYDTPENALLGFLLTAIEASGARPGWPNPVAKGAGAVASSRIADATKWKQHRMLASVGTGTPSPRTVARIRSGRHRRRFQPALDALELYRSLLVHIDRAHIRSLIETQGLSTRQNPTLFELLCTFNILDALANLGWQVPPLRLFAGSLHLTARRNHERLDLWYQTVPQQLRTSSRYIETLIAHGFASPADLRPDLVLRIDGGQPRWLLVECKVRKKGVEEAARAALTDLLAYRKTFEVGLADTSGVVGLGIAWGEGLAPRPSEQVLLATPERIMEALEMFLD